MKDYCTSFPETFRGKFIGDCCKIHDNMCGQAGTYNFLKTIKPFYICLRSKTNVYVSVGITFGGSFFCLLKFPYLVYKKYTYRRNVK